MKLGEKLSAIKLSVIDKIIYVMTLMALLLFTVMPISVYAGDTHIVTFHRYPDNGGTTSPAMDWITVSDTAGTQLSVMATPADGYTFYSWTDTEGDYDSKGGFKSYSSSCLAPVAARHDLYAYFVKSSTTGIVVKSDNEDQGTVIGTRTWSWGADGQYFTISATPKDPTQYEFDYWEKNGTKMSFGAPAEVPMPKISSFSTSSGEASGSKDEYTAHFKSKGSDHGFRAVVGTEGGNITGQPYLSYTNWKGSDASVTANPAEGYDFVKWVAPDGSDYSTNKSITVPYPSPEPSDADKKNDIVYTAMFAPHDAKGIAAEARLNSETGDIDGGSVSPSYVEWTDSNKNQAISFTATPDKNMKFVKWIVPDSLAVKSSLSNANLSVVMPASKPADNITIIAVFAADDKHEVYFDVFGKGDDGKYNSGIGGTINPPMVNPDENNDTNVNVQANAWEGYEFERWELSDGSASSVVLPSDLTKPSISITVKKQSNVPSDVHIKAYFKKAEYKGIYSYGIEGGDTSPRFTKWQSGASFELTATPKSGYVFDHWERYNCNTKTTEKTFVGSDSAHYSGVFTTEALTDDIIYYAYFKKESGYGIYSEGVQGGDTSPRFTRWSEATKGSSVTLSATPDDGYIFDHWRYYNKETGETLENYSKISTISVKMPLEEIKDNRYYYAIFKPVGNLGIYTEAVGNTGGDTSPKFTQWTVQNRGTSITVSATPAKGYEFDHWRYFNKETGETIENYSRVPTISVLMPKEINDNIYYYAVFKEENKYGIYSFGVEGGETSPRFTQWTQQNKGSSITLSATSNEGYKFSHWRFYNKATNETIENFSYSPTISVRMPEAEPEDSIYYFAIFEKETNCGIYSYGVQGGDTSPRFTKWTEQNKGTSISLTATAENDFVFDHWKYYNEETGETIENYSALATISVKIPNLKMHNNIYYYAVFRKVSNLGIYSQGIEGGETAPKFTQWSESTRGQSITLTATADKDYEFDHWRYLDKETGITIENYSTNPTISVVMPSEMADSRYYYAIFKKIAVKGIYSYGIEGGDTSPRFTQWSDTTKGQSIQLQATPAEGYEFDHWRYYNQETEETIENYSTLASISVVMPNELNKNRYYYAVFRQAVSYGIYSYGIQGGDTSPRFTKWSEQNKGSSISLTATAEDEYVFDHWRYYNAETEESIENYSNLPTISVKIPDSRMTANHYYYAVFRKTGDMGIYAQGIEGGEANPRYVKWSEQTKGTSISLTATPNAGYEFDHWRFFNKETGATIENYSTNSTISVIMPNEMIDSHYYYAIFKNTSEYGIYSYGIEGGDTSPRFTLWTEGSKGQSVQLQATPAEGYEFDHWRYYNEETGETIENYSTISSISVKMPVQKLTANLYYYAVFRKVSGVGIYSFGIEGGETTPRYVKWSDQTKGTSITLQATPAKGYDFDHWRYYNKETGATIENYSRVTTISVKMPEQRPLDNIYYYAIFKRNNERVKNKEIHVIGKKTGIADESFLNKWRTWTDPVLKYVRSTIESIAKMRVAGDASVYEGNKPHGYDSGNAASELKAKINKSQMKHSQSLDNPNITDINGFNVSEVSGLKTVFLEGTGAKSEDEAKQLMSEKYGELYDCSIVLEGDIYFEDGKGNRIKTEPSEKSSDATVVITGIDTTEADIWMMIYIDSAGNEFTITPISDADSVVRFTLPDRSGGKITLLSVNYR